ncbi:MAG: hypothetical protein JWO52_498 [Gammaproteobacteria bacterium]|jgi:hypothetical protein|nr:hypothetical protein [Gammaproteobacteria bacterium]
MATLRHPDSASHRVLFQPHHTCVTADTVLRECSCPGAPRFKARKRGSWLRSTGEVLLIGRDLLFALWAVTVLAFWLAIIAALVL